MREHALDNLTLGIDRATRLVDQLLTLSRLDSLSDLAELAPIDWNDLVTMTLAEQDRQAHAAGVTLRYEHRGTPPPRQGKPCCCRCYCATCWITRCATPRRAASSP